MKWSLRVQFLVAIAGLLLGCLSVYLFLAVSVFKSDKTELVYEINKSQVSNLSHELEAELSTASDKLKMFAYLTELKQRQLTENLLSDTSDLVAAYLYKPKSSEALSQIQNEKFLETYGLSKEEFFPDLIKNIPIPFEEILKKGELVWSANLPQSPPLIAIGKLVILEDEKKHLMDRRLVIGFLKTDRFLKSLSSFSLSEVTLTNVAGEILLESNSLPRVTAFKDDPLFLEAVKSKARFSVLHLENSLAAFAKAYQGQIYVFSRSDNQIAFQAVTDLLRRTFLFGSIVVTLAMLISVLMSRRLTKNISLLADRMNEVSAGDLSSPIHLQSQDETGLLAKTFNQMIVDLKSSRDNLEKMNHELDQKVQERTQELEDQGKKMNEIQDALLRTTRLASVGEVAGRTAHEVLNPLTNMLTRIQKLEKNSKRDLLASVDLLADIQGAWEKDFATGGLELLMKNLQEKSTVDAEKSLLEEDLQNLRGISIDLKKYSENLANDSHLLHSEGLRISKIVNGMRKLNRQHSDLQMHSVHQVIQDSYTLLKEQFLEHGFDLEIKLQAQNDLCNIDHQELLQALSNLMRNSLQALQQVTNPTGPLKLSIETSDEGGLLKILVKDNGVGIEPMYQDRLFDSKFTTKSAEDGTGLGLSISRRFIRNFGGELEFVGSVPLKETAFQMMIPLVRSQGAVA